jgi:hypothetical protein
VDIAFNAQGCRKILKSLMPEMYDIEVEETIKYINRYYNKIAEFDIRSEDTLLKRSVVKQQLTYAIEDTSSTDYIQSDVIILGEEHNWPRFTDIAIKKFKNKQFNFTNIDKIDELLQSHNAAYVYLKSKLTDNNTKDIVSIIPKVSSANVIYDISFDLAMIAPILDVAKVVHGANVNTTDYIKLLKQLKSMDLSDCIYYAVNNKEGKISKMIPVKIDQMRNDIMSKNTSYQSILIYSEFNLIKKIINTELDNPGKYLDLIKKNKIRTATDFYAIISKKDKDKIMQLVGDRNKRIYAKPCAHNEPLQNYMSLYKVIMDWAKDKRDKAKKDLMKFLTYDKNAKQHFCNSCGERVICDHAFDLAGVKHKDKIAIVEKYRDPEDYSKKYSYCKYCHEQIFRNELEEIMTEVKFEEIVRSRQQTMEGDTQAATFENGLYFGVSNSISALKIDYEYPQRALVKSIMNIIFNMVSTQVSKLHIENDLDQYEKIVGLYGYLYTAIYMMSAFISDPKINTLDKTPKNRDDYAKYFALKSSQRFHGMSSSENTKRIILQAFLDLKSLATPTISARNEADKILDILQNPLFLILYRMHLCGHPSDSTLDAFNKIVTQPKPTVTTFHLSVNVPTKNISQRKQDLYTYLMDYKSPYCYIFQYETRPTGASNLVYDPKLHNQFVAEQEKINETEFINHYTKLLNAIPGKQFCKCYGANYIYDDEGSIIDWSNNLEWTTKSGKTIKFSDIKKHVDESTDEKIAKRNQIIKFHEQKFKHKLLTGYTYVKLDNPPNYISDKKLLGIVSKINNKYNPNMLEYLGRSTGYNYLDLIRGIIPGVEQYVSGYCRVKHYCQLFIEKYYSLKYEPMGESNIKIIEESGIDFGKLEEEASKLPDLPHQQYYEESSKLVNLLEPKSFYEWTVEQFTKFIIIVEKSGGVLGKLYVENFLKSMITSEKRLSLPNPKKIAGGIVVEGEETEYDEAEDAKGEKSKFDEIDYEQDEDDIDDD